MWRRISGGRPHIGGYRCDGGAEIWDKLAVTMVMYVLYLVLVMMMVNL